MTNTESIFQPTIQKTDSLLSDIEKEFGWKDRKNQAYSALRAVLHTLRDRLQVDSAVNFGAQLPMLVRGFYYEGWKPSRVPIKMSAQEFIDHVQSQFQFQTDVEMPEFINRVLQVVAQHIEPGEMQKIKDALPKELEKITG